MYVYGAGGKKEVYYHDFKHMGPQFDGNKKNQNPEVKSVFFLNSNGKIK